jgi:RNA ligase
MEIEEVQSSFIWGGEEDENTIHASLQPYEERVQQKLLSKSECNDLISYKYTDKCVYENCWDDFTHKARGIIFNKKTGECVAKVWPKFFNLNEKVETSLKNLPKEPYEVFDKRDGSAGVLFWEGDEPKIATLGSFASPQALEATKMLKELYPKIKDLRRDLTLLFEIIYPENKIVCDYKDKRELVLLSAFNRLTGEEANYSYLQILSEDIGFPLVEKYDLTIEQMIELQKTLPKDKEGFIVRFKSGLRLKIKGEEYLKLHRIVSGITPLNIWRELKNGLLPDSYKKMIPEELLPDVEKIESELNIKWNNIFNEIRADIERLPLLELDEKNNLTKISSKLLGLFIKDNNLKHSGILFSYFNDKTGEKVNDYISKQIRPTSNVL